ncbi:RNA polymerase sigma factor (plasmid) [Clostridium estertheticum]|uniref:RNA polymerase sigma factor n=1 Tax=Clostridium estertheticum TaxID=238834 RepID=UPI001C7CD0C9|nr:RNA polymerase sigma factor [Clostridium estertheticum]MBX4260391.1 RNA polymerase sigma factor [Clostridium estertheticum]WLC73027.1 RNA polymerase sigma factor [Clostridium estertheticum]
MDKDFFLIRRMKHGDESAVNDFVKQYSNEIYKYCYYKLSNKWQAEDVTQDTFISFFKHFNSYIHKGKAKNYLYIIAGNLCKNEYKKNKEVSILQAEEEIVNSKQVQEEIVLKVSMDQEISRLPKEFKEVIHLYYFQDLKIREVAEILDINISLVKYRLLESKKLLKKSIHKEDFYGYSFKSENSSL